MLITGARTSTLLQRLPYLPSADVYVAENGGRIFYPDQTLPTAMPIMEDTKWRKSHTTAGEALPACPSYLPICLPAPTPVSPPQLSAVRAWSLTRGRHGMPPCGPVPAWMDGCMCA